MFEMEWQRRSLQFLPALIAIQFLAGCAAETYALNGCPQVPPSIARSAKAIIIGTVQGAGYNFQTGPFVVSMYQIHPTKVVKESSNRLSGSIKVVATFYYVPGSEPEASTLTDGGFLLGPRTPEVGSISVVALDTISPDIATHPGYDGSADYEVIFQAKCSEPSLDNTVR